MNRRAFLGTVPAATLAARPAVAAPEPTLRFDASRPGDPIRALHGVNGGRTDTGEVTVELPAHAVGVLTLRRHGHG